ncbi:hypothetical protein I552_6866, partial [Mycobacterium xenopi 3993]
HLLQATRLTVSVIDCALKFYFTAILNIEKLTIVVTFDRHRD